MINVNRARRRRGVVRLVPVDAGSGAVFSQCADRERVPVGAQAHRKAELVPIAEHIRGPRLSRVGRLDIGRLCPRAAATREDVDSAGLRDRLVFLIAVDALRVARLPICRHGHRVAIGAERHGMAECGVCLRVRSFQVGLLGPATPAPQVHVDGAGIENRVVALIAVDARGPAGLVRCANGKRHPVGADGDALSGMALEHSATAEVVGGFGIRRFEIGGLAHLRGRRGPTRWGLRCDWNHDRSEPEDHDSHDASTNSRAFPSVPAAPAHRSSPSDRSPFPYRPGRCWRVR